MPALVRLVIMPKEVAVHSTLGYRSLAEFEARATGSQSGIYAMGERSKFVSDGQGMEGLVRLLFTQLLPALTSIPPAGAGLSRLVY
jgi:hypothetical protein